MLVGEPEVVVVEPEVEVEVEDVLLDEWEVVVLEVALRLAELTVPLVAEELLPAKPVGNMG